MTQNNSTPAPRLIPAKTAAKQLGIPYSSLRDSVHRGELAVVRRGRNERHSAWYFERRDIDRWLETRKQA
jgi:excisionase family DNA binding protein